MLKLIMKYTVLGSVLMPTLSPTLGWSAEKTQWKNAVVTIEARMAQNDCGLCTSDQLRQCASRTKSGEVIALWTEICRQDEVVSEGLQAKVDTTSF